jgi:hypothetical protein
MVMDVDAVRPARGLLRALRHQLSREQSGSAERGERAKKTAPRRAAAAGKTGNVVVFRSGHRGPPSLKPSQKVSYHGDRRDLTAEDA